MLTYLYLYNSDGKKYGVHISWNRLFWAGNQGNHQNFDPSLLTYNCWLIFMGMKQKKILLKKKSKWPTQKSDFFFRQFSMFFRENFRDWSLGRYNKLMRRALVWLNLYGHQTVQRKLKKGLKMHFLCFQPFFELTSDSLTTI